MVVSRPSVGGRTNGSKMNYIQTRLGSLLLSLALLLPLPPAVAESAGTAVPAAGVSISSAQSQEALPDQYDLRQKGLVTEVKDQGQNETCWAFALSSVMESNALVRGYGTKDISECQVAYSLSHTVELKDDLAAGEGPECTEDWLEGIFAQSLSSELMRGFAIQSEQDFPYSGLRKAFPPAGISKNGMLYVDSCYSVPITETETVKRLLMENGALYLMISAGSWWDGPNFHWGTNSAYLPDYGDDYHNDHFVAIVGWIDDYSPDNFLFTPPGKGAWIMKNSWGPNYGDNGFFFLSYYDAAINPNNCATSITVRDEKNYDKLYQYDGGVGLQTVERVTDVAINFTAGANEFITGVRIKPVGNLFSEYNYAADWSFESTDAWVRVYRGSFDGTGTEEAEPIYTQKYRVVYPDYQTIPLEKDVPLLRGENYYVKVSFDRPVFYAVDGQNTAFPLGYRSNAWGYPGETFLRSENELGVGTWQDSTAVLQSGDTASACIKVLSKYQDTPTIEILRELVRKDVDLQAAGDSLQQLVEDFFGAIS